MKKLLVVVLVVGACTNPDSIPTAPVAEVASSAFATGSDEKVAVCHRVGDGAWNLLSIAAPAVNAHLEHGDELAGGPVLDANCAPVPVDDPYFFRDDFNAPLNPRHWSVVGPYEVHDGTLDLIGASYLTFTPTPTPVDDQIVRVEWEIGWIQAPGEFFNLIRAAGPCELLCQDDVVEAIFGNEVLIRHDSDGIWETNSPSVSVVGLQDGPHTMRVVWNRTTRSAAYWVDDALVDVFPTDVQFETVPRMLQFSKTTRTDIARLTYFQFRAFNRASTI